MCIKHMKVITCGSWKYKWGIGIEGNSWILSCAKCRAYIWGLTSGPHALCHFLCLWDLQKKGTPAAQRLGLERGGDVQHNNSLSVCLEGWKSLEIDRCGDGCTASWIWLMALTECALKMEKVANFVTYILPWLKNINTVNTKNHWIVHFILFFYPHLRTFFLCF